MRPIRQSLLLLFASAVLLSFASDEACPLLSAKDILRAAQESGSTTAPFDLEAKIVIPAIVPKRIFTARVGTCLFSFGVDPFYAHLCPTNAGDHVRLKGEFRRKRPGEFTLNCVSVDILSSGPPEIPQPISGRQFYTEDFPNMLVRLSGTVRTIRPDEIDPDYNFLTLNCDGETIYAALCVADADPQHLSQLAGADVTVSGVIARHSGGHRSLMGRHLSVSHASDIRLDDRIREDWSTLSSVTALHPNRVSDLQHLGRHRAAGTVLAVWRPSSALLKTEDGELVRIGLRPGNLPERGTRIECSGFPETDFSHLGLSGAVWRQRPGTPMRDETPTSIALNDLFVDTFGRPRLHPEFHGRTIRVNGEVSTQPQNGCFTLSADDLSILVDASALTDATTALTKEMLVEISGICIMDAESWRPDFTFPHIRSVMIVPRAPSDIRILRRPPWWTPLRFATVIGSLLVALLAILIWNRSLRRLAAKRGRELADKTIAQAESELKVYERTRLATELHDSLSQILTGVAFKLETVDRLAETDPAAMRQHLDIAIRSLQACRDDLRNCLWDLRNHALEIPDMDKAIRRTLEQHLEGTDLAIRFNVPRERLSDNTTHEILCIIRELVLNAIRHGHATEVRVAGAIEDDTLRFSVADNGCGFDPDRCPGMREGHYGLQGVRERAAHLDGEFTIRPNVTGGMKAVVSIKIPHTT